MTIDVFWTKSDANSRESDGRVRDGEQAHHQGTDNMVTAIRHSLLTEREQSILRGVAAGRTNKEIAKQLGISPNTVTSYLSQIYDKLQARSRSHAVVRAVQFGFL